MAGRVPGVTPPTAFGETPKPICGETFTARRQYDFHVGYSSVKQGGILKRSQPRIYDGPQRHW
jgi:hypothetical protein